MSDEKSVHIGAASDFRRIIHCHNGAVLKLALIAAMIATTLASCGTPNPAPTGIPADATEATVEWVHDGDTIFLEDGRKVRLLGINTPEIGEHRECYGDEATALLKQLLPQGTHVWVVHDIEPLDQYGRSLLFIYTDDGTNINIELLELGAAEVEMYKPNLLFEKEIRQAEADAQAANLGLWAACR